MSWRLKEAGIEAVGVAQEHSQVATLYRRSGTWVVWLGARWETVRKRRRVSWSEAHYREELQRLRVARSAARLVVHTDALSESQVTEVIVRWFDTFFGFRALWMAHPEWTTATRAAVRRSYHHAP
ncbi:MAG: hypothetical protein OWU84_02445 [Firmicutes bacterium]|nr:hypothetical protein [Bacillota bacterium]